MRRYGQDATDRKIKQAMREMFARVARTAAQKKREPRYLMTTTLALEALLSPRIGHSVMEYLSKAWLGATSSTERQMQYFGYCRPWTLGRGVMDIALIELLDLPDDAILAGLCADCNSVEVLSRASKRDFGVSSFELMMPPGTA